MLRVDERNPRARALWAGLSPLVQLDDLDPDICVVVGGDGWLLRTVRELGQDLVYLGLNAGTLGFLLNEVQQDALEGLATQLREQAWNIAQFPLLAMSGVPYKDGPELMATALNDVYVERRTGQIAHLRLSVDGVVVVERLACDGIIAATALGSTAYSFSAGASPCHPALRAMQVTPICPHRPRLSPLTLPWGSVLDVEVLDPDRRPVRAVADGEDQGRVRSLRVGPDGGSVKLAFLAGHDFTRTLVAKVLKV